MSDYSQIKESAKNRMEKTLETLRTDFGGLRAGRAHASLLDGIPIGTLLLHAELIERASIGPAPESSPDKG